MEHELTRFLGIIVSMPSSKSEIPQISAKYNDTEASLHIGHFGLLSGNLRPRVHGLVVEWMATYRKELNTAWEHVQMGKEPNRIEPLV